MSEILRQTWLLRDLTESEAQTLLQECEFLTLKSGDFVIERGGRNDSLWIIEAGRFGVVKPGEESAPQKNIVAELRRGDIFGEMSWLDGHAPSASIVSLEPAELIRIRFDKLDRFLGTSPDAHIGMLRKFAINLSHRLRTYPRK